MKEIKLTQGFVALVDDEDYEYLNQFKWYAHKYKTTIYAERVIRIENKQVHIHMHYDILKIKSIDHVDTNGLNNQKSNLRKCTQQQNCMNRTPRKNTTSKYKGVYWKKESKKWCAHIGFNKKLIHLGYFYSEIEAAKAYDNKAKEYFNEFANLNFK